MINRRVMIQDGLSAAASAVLPATISTAKAQSRKHVKLMLAWTPEGSNAFVFVTRALGFWAKRNLDVEIVRGFGSFPAANAVAAGHFEFAMTSPSSVILLATKSIDLRMISLFDYDSFMAVGLLKDSFIKAPRDLSGHSIGQTFASSDAVFFKLFAERNGIDLSTVSMSNVDAKIRNQSLISRQYDAITGFVSSMLPAFAVQNIPTRFLLYRDYGIDLYGNIGVVCRPETAAGDPDLCDALVAGMNEGLHYTLIHPQQAVELFLKEVPEAKLGVNGAESVRLGMAVHRASVLSERSVVDHGLGWADLQRLADTADLVLRYQAAPDARPPDLARVATNAFVGAEKLTATEWSLAKDETKWIVDRMRGT